MMMRRLLTWALWCCIGLAATLSHAAPVNTPLNKMVVFGDSLSDTGNLYEYMEHQLPVSPPYFEGRFSNGPIWVEYLVNWFYPKDAQAHMLNYAFGGAGVSDPNEEEDDTLFTLTREVDSYLLAHHDVADERSLYIIWMGSNNYIALPDDPDEAPQATIRGIHQTLTRLADKGAKHIMVVTLPDLGRTPAAQDFDMADVLTSMTKQHNAMLFDEVVKLKEQYSDVQWLLFDVNDMFIRAVTWPETFGLTNVTETCYEFDSMSDRASDPMLSKPNLSIFKIASNLKPRLNQAKCDGYLFFDPIHPTTAAHKMIMEESLKLLQAEGVMFE